MIGSVNKDYTGLFGNVSGNSSSSFFFFFFLKKN
jgi:hypothetical protein